jgi:hypothetical protein
MRALVVASIITLLVYQGPTLYDWANDSFFGEVDPHVQPAIALRCDEASANARAECEHELRREFASGTIHPEAIVRRHCTRYANRWSEDAEPPARVCSELYGGWIEG